MSSNAPLPQILAGPILRRTEPDRVCVWIATSQQVQVTGYVYDVATLSSKDPKPLGSGETLALRFGENLFVALVQIKPIQTGKVKLPPQPFPNRRLLAYDLVLTLVTEEQAKSKKPVTVGSGSVRLRGHPELQGDNRITYGSYPMPTFLITQDGNVNILHGSCRKPHGAGEDALAVADFILQKHLTNLNERPSALFLTGDQIYADDVADALIGPLIDLGFRLLGFEEKVPFPPNRPVPTREIPVRGLSAGQGLRGQLLKDVFTPDKKDSLKLSTAKNHLLGFGEFAAMYLMAWNIAFWTEKLQPPDSKLEAMRKTLPAVRRVLANIPTYMIMDDHEITDDWNLTLNWQNRVQNSATGTRIIANGLAAYWVFQAWGNDPDSFPESFYTPIIEYVSSKGASKKYENTLTKPQNPQQWAFFAPTHPPTIFLDTRTRRGFDQKKPDDPPELLEEKALQDFIKLVQQSHKGKSVEGKLLLIVLATPVFGIPDIEAFLENQGRSNPAEYDVEFWHANRKGMYKFLSEIHNLAPQACIFLSGDVHYAFAIYTEYWTGKRTTFFTQFTSSALKNQPTGIQKLAFNLGSSFSSNIERLKTSGEPDTVIISRSLPSSEFFRTESSNLGQLQIPSNTPQNTATLNFFEPPGGNKVKSIKVPLVGAQY